MEGLTSCAFHSRLEGTIYENEGKIPESRQGQYQGSGVFWHSESLNKKVRRYVQENAFVKSSAITTFSFCHWVNEQLLINETLEPGYPRTISVETVIMQWKLY